MSVWNVYFDGLCEPNPGGVIAWGFVIDASRGGLHTGKGVKAAAIENTNNVAEYCGLGFALREVLKLRAANELLGDAIYRERFDGLHIRGDSKLVVEQINGQWAVKSEKLAPLHKRCLELLGITLMSWAVEWIPREENVLADKLSRDAYRKLTGVDAPQRWRAA